MRSAWIMIGLTAPLMGCQALYMNVSPERMQQIRQSNIPRELQKTTMPEYVVEPPDILDVEVYETLPNRPITGERLVRPDGTIQLGFYGEVYVAGLTLREVKQKIIDHLRETEILGEALLKPENFFVDVSAYNSKVYYVQGAVGTPGRYPITGNETVLDAINLAGGIRADGAHYSMKLVRPAPPGSCCDQILPVKWEDVVQCGDTSTNYQLMPGDRIFVDVAPLVKADTVIARVTTPIERIINTIFLGQLTAVEFEVGRQDRVATRAAEFNLEATKVDRRRRQMGLPPLSGTP